MIPGVTVEKWRPISDGASTFVSSTKRKNVMKRCQQNDLFNSATKRLGWWSANWKTMSIPRWLDSVEKYPDNEPGLLDVVCVYRRGLVHPAMQVTFKFTSIRPLGLPHPIENERNPLPTENLDFYNTWYLATTLRLLHHCVCVSGMAKGVTRRHSV